MIPLCRPAYYRAHTTPMFEGVGRCRRQVGMGVQGLNKGQIDILLNREQIAA